MEPMLRPTQQHRAWIYSLSSAVFPSTVSTITATLPWLPPSLRIENDTLPDSSSTVSDVGCSRNRPAPASSSIIVSSAESAPVVDSLGDETPTPVLDEVEISLGSVGNSAYTSTILSEEDLI